MRRSNNYFRIIWRKDLELLQFSAGLCEAGHSRHVSEPCFVQVLRVLRCLCDLGIILLVADILALAVLLNAFWPIGWTSCALYPTTIDLVTKRNVVWLGHNPHVCRTCASYTSTCCTRTTCRTMYWLGNSVDGSILAIFPRVARCDGLMSEW